jgi:hypothetical protein
MKIRHSFQFLIFFHMVCSSSSSLIQMMTNKHTFLSLSCCFLSVATRWLPYSYICYLHNGGNQNDCIICQKCNNMEKPRTFAHPNCIRWDIEINSSKHIKPRLPWENQDEWFPYFSLTIGCHAVNFMLQPPGENLQITTSQKV